MKKKNGYHRLKKIKHSPRSVIFSLIWGLLGCLCLSGLTPSYALAYEKRFCANCHLDFQGMPLSSVRQKAGLGQNLSCPGLQAASMEMDQIESWILSISRNLLTVKDIKNREKIEGSLHRISDYYRSQLSCEVASVSEIHQVMRKIQRQLDLKVFRKILTDNKRQDLQDLLGWFASFTVIIGIAYFIACKRRSRYDSTYD